MNAMPDLYPAVIRAYDPETRLVRVEIPGVTDGGELLPEAEFNYPLGDKSEHTEIRVLAGDRVWVSFAGGDPRYPVVMGYRNKRVGNDLDWRRWHHQNIQLEADEVIHIKGKNIVIDGADSVTVNTKAATVNATDSVAVNTKQATVDATESVSVTTATAAVTATTSASIDSPTTAVSGHLSVGGNLTVTGNAEAANVSASGDVTAGNISLKNHKHPGVTPGGGQTGTPV